MTIRNGGVSTTDGPFPETERLMLVEPWNPPMRLRGVEVPRPGGLPALAERLWFPLLASERGPM